MERADGLKGPAVRGTEDAPRGRQKEGVFHNEGRYAAIVKIRGEETIVVSDNASGAGCTAVRFQNPADIILFSDLHDLLWEDSSALRLPQGRPIDFNGVAEVAEAAEQRVDHGAVTEEVVPFVIS